MRIHRIHTQEMNKIILSTLLPLIFGPFNFRPGVAENKRGQERLAFFWVAENKAAEIFLKPLYNSKQKRKKIIFEGGRK